LCLINVLADDESSIRQKAAYTGFGLGSVTNLFTITFLVLISVNDKIFINFEHFFLRSLILDP